MTVDPSTLTLAEKASLLSGRDLWSTQDLPESTSLPWSSPTAPTGCGPPTFPATTPG